MDSSDLALLVTLDALLQEGSVTRAARRVGLSTPAVSHALARIRERLGDPLLVRAGRAMVLTPRAEELRPRVRSIVAEAAQVLEPLRDFDPKDLRRTFVIHTTDYVLTVLGVALDRAVRAEAPGVALQFLPTVADDPTALREGSADLAVGIYGELPPEVRTRQLVTDRFVCVVRKDHPSVGKRLTLEEFARLEHVQIVPRGRPGGYLDDALAERGLKRRVARIVPYFLAGLRIVTETDYVLTVSERIAKDTASQLGLRLLEPPLPLAPYALSLIWHPRFDGDAAHSWLRETFVRVAKARASDVHANVRTKLTKRALDPEKGRSARAAR